MNTATNIRTLLLSYFKMRVRAAKTLGMMRQTKLRQHLCNLSPPPMVFFRCGLGRLMGMDEPREQSRPGKWTARLSRISSRLPPRAKLLGGLTQGLMSACAAILAYLPTKPLGLQEGFWGSITAIAVVQSELAATRSSARDQFAGAAIGGVLGAALVSLAGQSLLVYAIAVVAAMTACWLFNVSSAARLAGSTATIIALVPHHGSVEWMMLSRVAEVGWGVAIGILVVWLVNRFLKRPNEVQRHTTSANSPLPSPQRAEDDTLPR
jgi:uncharacterized membrane protein YccC